MTFSSNSTENQKLSINVVNSDLNNFKISSNQGQSTLSRAAVQIAALHPAETGSEKSRTCDDKVPDPAGVESASLSLYNGYKCHLSRFIQIGYPESGSTAWTDVMSISSIERETSSIVPTAANCWSADSERESASNDRDMTSDLSSSSEADAGDARVPDRSSTFAVFNRSCSTADSCALIVFDSNTCVRVCGAQGIGRHCLLRDGTRSSESDWCGSLRTPTSKFAETSTSVTRPAWPPPPKRFLSKLLAAFD